MTVLQLSSPPTVEEQKAPRWAALSRHISRERIHMQPDQGQGSQPHHSPNGGQQGSQAVGARYAAPAPGRNGSHPAPQASQPSGSGSSAAATDRKVFRLPGAVVAWWAWIVVAMFCLIDMAATGPNHTSAEIAVALLLVTGVMYACALRPKVVTDAVGITVQNPLRDHRVPWGSVTSVDSAESVRIHTVRPPGAKREKVIHSWALYAQRRSRIKMEMMQQGPRRLPRSPFAADSTASSENKEPAALLMAKQLDEMAKDARERGVPGGPAISTWSWWSAAAIVAPAIALVLVITLTH